MFHFLNCKLQFSFFFFALYSAVGFSSWSTRLIMCVDLCPTSSYYNKVLPFHTSIVEEYNHQSFVVIDWQRCAFVMHYQWPEIRNRTINYGICDGPHLTVFYFYFSFFRISVFRITLPLTSNFFFLRGCFSFSSPFWLQEMTNHITLYLCIYNNSRCFPRLCLRFVSFIQTYIIRIKKMRRI